MSVRGIADLVSEGALFPRQTNETIVERLRNEQTFATFGYKSRRKHLSAQVREKENYLLNMRNFWIPALR